jgi:hypothetical protein
MVNTLKRIGWIVFLSGFLLSGCATETHSYLIKKDLITDSIVTKARLELAFDGGRLISVSEYRNPGERAALATSVSSAYQATPPPQGASPGGMAAAFFLTTYVAKASADSKVHSESNKKVQQLIRIVNQEESQQSIKNSLQQHFLSLSSMEIVAPDVNVEICCDGRVIISPQVRFSNDLRLMEVKVDYLISKKDSKDPIYSNSFIYQTDPAPEPHSINFWAKNEAEQFVSTLDTAFAEIVKLVDYEFMHGVKDDKNSRITTIKYNNGQRVLYERGTLLLNKDRRIILRDLRGNIRSFRGEII